MSGSEVQTSSVRTGEEIISKLAEALQLFEATNEYAILGDVLQQIDDGLRSKVVVSASRWDEIAELVKELERGKALLGGTSC